MSERVLSELIVQRSVVNAAGCWVWSGCKTARGYGRLWNGHKAEWAHRVAYTAFVGDCAGVVIRHKCDTPACVNPDHLEPGSQADNIADAVRKGRIAVGTRLPHAKLTATSVRAIRVDERSQEQIAREYRVSQSTISTIKARKSWRHIL